MEEEAAVIEVAKADGVAKVHLNRPGALNALTRSLRQTLADRLDEIAHDATVRAVIILGAGRAFSVGQDLHEMDSMYREKGPHLAELVEKEYIPLVKALRRMPKPVVAMIDGPAAGGGLSLALAADFRILTAKSTLIPAFVNVGLAPDTGAAFFLARQLGIARAIAVAMKGEPLSAEQCVHWGLADLVVADRSAAEDEAQKLAQKLAQGPTLAYYHIRTLFDQAAGLPFERVLELERDTQETLAQTHDHVAAVGAFLNRQRPTFEGR